MKEDVNCKASYSLTAYSDVACSGYYGDCYTIPNSATSVAATSITSAYPDSITTYTSTTDLVIEPNSIEQNKIHVAYIPDENEWKFETLTLNPDNIESNGATRNMCLLDSNSKTSPWSCLNWKRKRMRKMIKV